MSMSLGQHVKRAMLEDLNKPVNTKQIKITVFVLLEIREKSVVHHNVYIGMEKLIGKYLMSVFEAREYKLDKNKNWLTKVANDVAESYNFLNALSASITKSGEEVFRHKCIEHKKRRDNASAWLKVVDFNKTDLEASFHKQNTLNNLGFMVIHNNGSHISKKMNYSNIFITD